MGVGKDLKDVGYDINCVLTGDTSFQDISNLHLADLNLVQCHRSINYIAEMMETKYGTPWIKVNFIGVESTAQSLRQLAQCFQDGVLTQRTEEVIARETARIMPAIEQYRKICTGKTAFTLVGGSRSHHYQYLLRDLGMEVVVAGYEFAHRNDYEGRQVIPSIVPDADQNNIPELHLVPDQQLFREGHVHLSMSKEKFEDLKKQVSLNVNGGERTGGGLLGTHGHEQGVLPGHVAVVLPGRRTSRHRRWGCRSPCRPRRCAAGPWAVRLERPGQHGGDGGSR